MVAVALVRNAVCGGLGSGGKEPERPMVDIAKEFELIQQKKSSLSAQNRKWVEARFHEIFEEVKEVKHDTTAAAIKAVVMMGKTRIGVVRDFKDFMQDGRSPEEVMKTCLDPFYKGCAGYYAQNCIGCPVFGEKGGQS